MAIVGPIPPYSNVPINPQFFLPSQFFIANITLGVQTTVTTTINHNYVIAQSIRLIIPPTFGCRQLNEAQGLVLSIPAPNQVVVSINSSMNVDPFTPSSATTKPQILAIGDISNGQINSNGRSQNITFIPGSFINISPV